MRDPNAVDWQIGSSATLGTDTDFLGNLIADQAITLNTRARILCGRAVALNAALTLHSNDLSNDCLRVRPARPGARGTLAASATAAALRPQRRPRWPSLAGWPCWR